MELSQRSDKELVAMRFDIERRNAHWKNSTDGSYEQAMDSSGYYRIGDEIERREKAAGDKL